MKIRCERWGCKHKAEIQTREWRLCNKCYHNFWKAWEIEHGSELFFAMLRNWFGHKRIRKRANKELSKAIEERKLTPKKAAKEFMSYAIKKKNKITYNKRSDYDKSGLANLDAITPEMNPKIALKKRKQKSETQQWFDTIHPIDKKSK